MDKWTPAAEGPGYEMTPILSPLEAVSGRADVLSGLADIAAESRAMAAAITRGALRLI